MNIGFETWESPVGRLHIAATDDALRAVAFDSNWQRIRATLGNVQAQGNTLTRSAIDQLQAYFAGARHRFDLPLQAHGTDFQQRTWQALRDIPYGTTRSYSEQAAAIGQPPQATRAIVHTNGEPHQHHHPLPLGDCQIRQVGRLRGRAGCPLEYWSLVTLTLRDFVLLGGIRRTYDC